MENQTIQNPISEPVVPVTPVLESKPQFPFLSILLVILLLISLGCTGFLYYQNMQLRGMLTSYQTPVSSPTPIVTTDPTTNWKTYTNNQAGFELKYPDDKFKFSDSSTKLTNTILPSDSDFGWLYLDILADKLSEPVSVSDWVSKNWPNQDKAARKDIKIGNVDAVLFDGGNIDPKSNKYLFIIKGNDIIQISAHYFNIPSNQGGGQNQYYTQIKNIWANDVDQILSTFKFVETPAATPTATPKPKVSPEATPTYY